MLSELSNYCNKVFKERIEDVQVGLYDNQKYNEVSLEIQEIRRKLIKKAPKGIKILIQDYEELLNISKNILVEKLYKQGVEDGLKITNII